MNMDNSIYNDRSKISLNNNNNNNDYIHETYLNNTYINTNHQSPTI